MRICYYCMEEKDPEAVRPYGPGASYVCLPCIEDDPVRNDLAVSCFLTQLDAAEALSTNGIVIDTVDGPQPFMGELEDGYHS